MVSSYPGYDAAAVARVLMEFTPLKKKDAAATGAELTKVLDAYWAGK